MDEIKSNYSRVIPPGLGIKDSQVCWSMTRANFVYAATPELEVEYADLGVEYQLQIRELNPLVSYRVVYIFQHRLQILLERGLVAAHEGEYLLTSLGLSEASKERY